MKAISKPISAPAPSISLPFVTSYQSLVSVLATNLQIIGIAVLSLMVQGSIIIPVSMLIILSYDFGYALWFVAPVIAGSFALLISNLTLAPVKFTLHLFFINVLLLVVVIVAHLPAIL